MRLGLTRSGKRGEWIPQWSNWHRDKKKKKVDTLEDKGDKLVNKRAYWTQDRLQSFSPLLLPRLPPLVGEQCWQTGGERRQRNTQSGRLKYTKRWHGKVVFFLLSVAKAFGSKRLPDQGPDTAGGEKYFNFCICLAFKIFYLCLWPSAVKNVHFETWRWIFFSKHRKAALNSD